jgi:hypothetical protein
MSGQTPTTFRSLPLNRVSDEPSAHPYWIAMATLALVAFTVPYTTNLIPWAYENGFFPIRPAIYQIITMLICGMVVMGRKPEFTMTNVWLVIFHLAYVFDAVVMSRFDHPSGEDFPMMTHGSILASVLILTWFIGVVQRLSHIPVLVAAALTVMIGSLSNIAEWFGVHDFSIVMGRAAGFHGDPNNSAIAIILALAIFLTLSKNIGLSFGLMGLSLVAVAITLSRSGIIAELILCISYLVVSYKKRPALITKAVAITIPVVIAGVVYLASNMSSQVLRESDIKDRLGALTGGDSQKMASGERMKDLNDGLRAIRLEPITGYGVGAGSTKWQPHNQLVTIWIDGGVIFASLYLLILALLTFKCAVANGRGGLCLIGVIIFIPFSQLLHTYIGYWITMVILVQITSDRFFVIQWFKSDSGLDRVSTSSTQPSNPTSEYA